MSTLIYNVDEQVPEFFKSCRDISERFAGVPVVTLRGFTPEQERLRQVIVRRRPHVGKLDSCALVRWLSIYDHVKGLPAEAWPIFCADWDMAVCSDLRPLFDVTKDADVCFTIDDHGTRGVAGVIRRIEPLMSFCDTLLSLINRNAPELGHTNDMALWADVVKTCEWKTQDVNLTSAGAVDHNIVCGWKHWQMDRCEFGRDGFSSRKKIVYLDGKAHFVKLDGTPVPVVLIHFWNYFEPLVFDVQKQIGL